MNGYLTILLLRPDIVCACVLTQLTFLQTTIYYWRVNSSSLDGALLLDFITQGPSYEPFTTLTKVEKGFNITLVCMVFLIVVRIIIAGII